MELGALLTCGALATLATFFWHPSLRIPGHTILPAVFPMVAGLALAPRRWGGLVMAAGAAATGPILHWGGVGEVQPAAFISVLALGPLIDLATLGEPIGWRLYARFISTGIAANLTAFAAKFGISALGWDPAGSHHITRFGWIAPASFVLCGAVAGLVSAIAWFRLRSRP